MYPAALNPLISGNPTERTSRADALPVKRTDFLVIHNSPLFDRFGQFSRHMDLGGAQFNLTKCDLCTSLFSRGDAGGFRIVRPDITGGQAKPPRLNDVMSGTPQYGVLLSAQSGSHHTI